jgi:hypothetical protein
MLKSAIVIVLLAFASSSMAAESPDLAKLQGKWTTKRTGSDGQESSFTMEIKGEKLTFQAFRGDNELRFVAKGNVKAEMQGPFRVMKITQIEAGGSVSDLQPVNDDRSTVYFLKDDTLTLASNFDKERDNEKPRVEVYQRVETKAASTPGEAAKLVGKWKMTAKLGEDERDYDINFAEADGKLSGTLVSPRSGEYKFKSITFSDGKLAMELPRTIDGNEVVFVYTGQLKGSELAGDVIVKGYEDQFKGSWTAKK